MMCCDDMAMRILLQKSFASFCEIAVEIDARMGEKRVIEIDARMGAKN